MSGGHFDYLERRVFELVNEIQESEKLFLSEFKETQRLDAEKMLKLCVKNLIIGATIARRIDYVISQDDGPDAFFIRAKEEIRQFLSGEV